MTSVTRPYLPASRMARTSFITGLTVYSTAMLYLRARPSELSLYRDSPKQLIALVICALLMLCASTYLARLVVESMRSSQFPGEQSKLIVKSKVYKGAAAIAYRVVVATAAAILFATPIFVSYLIASS